MTEVNAGTAFLPKTGNTGPVEIIFYTDPLCCWSWAIEPHWRKLLDEYGSNTNYRYCMGGLLPSWKNFNDPVNSVSRPIQMGPVWMHAQQLSGMPIRHEIWMRDAPASSYPACIAVKSVGLQSKGLEDIFLRMLRKSVMEEGENISKWDVINKIAKKLLSLDQSFDFRRFEQDNINDNGLEAFRKDLQETQYRHITRFPTLVIKNPDGRAISLSGYQTFDALENAVEQVGYQNTLAK